MNCCREPEIEIHAIVGWKWYGTERDLLLALDIKPQRGSSHKKKLLATNLVKYDKDGNIYVGYIVDLIKESQYTGSAQEINLSYITVTMSDFFFKLKRRIEEFQRTSPNLFVWGELDYW